MDTKNIEKIVRKTIKEVLKEQQYIDKFKKIYGDIAGSYIAKFNPGEKPQHEAEQFYNKLWETYDGDIPRSVQEKFANDWRGNIITENLQTHRPEDLMRKIRGLYSETEFGEYSISPDGFIIWEPGDRLAYEIYDEWREFRKNPNDETKWSPLIRLIKFYGYEIRKSNGLVVQIEPVLTREIKGVAKAYHITDATAADGILKSGIRAKNGPTWDFSWMKPTRIAPETQYSYFPRRVYLYVVQDEKFLWHEISEIASQVLPRGNKMAVFEVDTRNIPLYKDSVMPEPGAVFTYQNIPPELVKRIR